MVQLEKRIFYIISIVIIISYHKVYYLKNIIQYFYNIRVHNLIIKKEL
jgi:hypothetical protein